MRVDFDTRNAEAIAISRAGQAVQFGNSTRKARLTLLVGAAFLIGLWIVFVFYGAQPVAKALGIASSRDWMILIPALAVLLACAVGLARVVGQRYQRQLLTHMERDLPDGTPVFIEIDEAGVRFEGDGMSLFAAWRRVNRIVEVPVPGHGRMIGFFGPRVNFFVPPRAFDGEASQRSFLSAAIGLRDQAQPGA
ncbi:MAG: hypothetical protein AAFY73_07335 [Pseudomonadota bacterium]